MFILSAIGVHYLKLPSDVVVSCLFDEVVDESPPSKNFIITSKFKLHFIIAYNFVYFELQKLKLLSQIYNLEYVKIQESPVPVLTGSSVSCLDVVLKLIVVDVASSLVGIVRAKLIMSKNLIITYD